MRCLYCCYLVFVLFWVCLFLLFLLCCVFLFSFVFGGGIVVVFVTTCFKLSL